MIGKTPSISALTALLLLMPGVALAEASAAAAAATSEKAGNSTPADNSAAATMIAIQGYDPVAYFLDLRPEMGSAQFEYRWKGMTYRFTSASHRAAFVKEPDKYAPQYGGYSAFDIYHGRIAAGDPTLWSVYDGRLYLNGSEVERKKWLTDFVDYIESADNKWPKINPFASPPVASQPTLKQ